MFAVGGDPIRLAGRNDDGFMQLSLPFSVTFHAPLAHSVVAEVLQSLGPTSAGSQLLRQGLALTFDGAAQIKVPGITASANYATFVGEGQPIPVRQMSVSAGVTLEPRKFASEK